MLVNECIFSFVPSGTRSVYITIDPALKRWAIISPPFQDCFARHLRMKRSAASSANEISPAFQRWVNESVRTESRQGRKKIRSVIEIVGIRIKVNRSE